jgi:putative modified peptide
MSFQIPEPIVDRLLELLRTDDSFRASFIHNPREALASLGFAPASDSSVQLGIWACMKVDELASKEVIIASHGVLRRQFTTPRASYHPITLGQVASAKRVA